jgi:hypothetical protein
MSSPAQQGRWLRPPSKSFSDSGSADRERAVRFSTCADPAIVANGIARGDAGTKLGGSNDVWPIADTSEVWKDGSITATASGSTAVAWQLGA